MQIAALASDYDGTLASDGKVAPKVIKAIKKLKAKKRKFLLVTGRRVEDLLEVFPEITLCDGVVAENGAVLYWPATKRTELLCSAPPQNFVQSLYTKRVTPQAVGHAVIAMSSHQSTEVDAIIVEHGLDLQKIFNKDAMMILPKGVDKASGLSSLLGSLSISPKNVLGVGDAENDEPFLKFCGIAASTANALPSVQAIAQYHLRAPNGAGIEELVDLILTGDCADLAGSRP